MSQSRSTRGRYEILDEIGRGSMAIVHRARDPLADRDVAIKSILSPHGVSPERWEKFHEQFHRQAEAAEGLSHKGIVTVYDVDDDPQDGRPFIAMEFVAGPTLHELIRREGALNVEWALTVADTLADALQAAHDAGVVHPDFKPANILVRESDGAAKIADFGVLHYSDSTDVRRSHGTPAYIAPECILGQPADLKSELFTLAVILYEMLCGKPPFGGTIAELVRESIVDFPHARITGQVTDLAPAFDAFFDRALAKRPADRFQDGKSFREALVALREEQQRFKQKQPAQAGRTTDKPQPKAAPALVERQAVQRPAVSPATATSRAERRNTSRGRSLWSAGAIALLILSVVALVLVARTMGPPDGPPAPAVAQAAPTRAFFRTPPLTVLPSAPPKALEPAAALPEPQPAPQVAAPKPAAAAKPPAERRKSDKPATLAPTPAPAADTGAVDETPPRVETRAAIPAVETAQLALFVKSSLKEGTLTLRVDGREVYSTNLASDAKRWKKVIGRAHQDFAAQVEIPAGAHTITAQVLNSVKSREHEASVDVEIAAGQERGLRIVAGRTIGPPLTLTLE